MAAPGTLQGLPSSWLSGNILSSSPTSKYVAISQGVTIRCASSAQPSVPAVQGVATPPLTPLLSPVLQSALKPPAQLIPGMPANSTAELAYEIVQGPLVRWSDGAAASSPASPRKAPAPPTAVLLHGILGSRKNWGSFAKRLATEFPSWQFLLVDLRCHGDSTPATAHLQPHSVHSAAADVLQLLRRLRITPRVLIGHSFGGKVVLSMVDQAAKPVPWPIQVWVLDATPGKVRAGGDGEDHPGQLIQTLRRFPPAIQDRKDVVASLCSHGFSKPVSQWMTTNLRKAPSANGFEWTFDLPGIADMYGSYEDTNMWPVVDSVPRGFHINFLRAERSLHRWAREDVARIHAAEEAASAEAGGVEMHVLEDAGHWVHTDNPEGLFRILAPSFGNRPFTRESSS